MSSHGYQLIHTVDLHLDTWDLFYLRTHRADTIIFDQLRLQGWPVWFLIDAPARNESKEGANAGRRAVGEWVPENADAHD